LQLAGVGETRSAQQSEITCRESIWLSESAHGNVLRRPVADAGQPAETFQEVFYVNDSGKRNLSFTNGEGQ